MSFVWDIRSRFSHLKDIFSRLEAMEAENSLGQHKHNLNKETLLGLFSVSLIGFLSVVNWRVKAVL